MSQSRLGVKAGNGVFAARAFARDETLTYYGGKDLGVAGTETGERALEEGLRGAAARYILELGGRYVEANLEHNNPAHLINDAGPSHANAMCKGGGEVKTKKCIGRGDELYWCYGARYWQRWGPRIELPTTASGREGARGGRSGRTAGARGGRGGGRATASGRGRGRAGSRPAEGSVDGTGGLGRDRVLRQRGSDGRVGSEGVT